MLKLKQVAIALVVIAAAVCAGLLALDYFGIIAPGPGSGRSSSPISPIDTASIGAAGNSATPTPASHSGPESTSITFTDSALQSVFAQTASPSAVSAATDEAVLITTGIRTTAYTHTEADHIKYGKKTALGTDLRYTPEYHSVAADWSRFPLGTKFRMQGVDRLFVVDDYGKALVGSRTVDIYFPSKQQMNHWGVRNVNIDVVEFGNFHESRKILAGRANYPHCLEMLSSMTSDDWWKNFR